MEQIKTMSDVRKAAEKTGLPIELIQEKTGVYEYNFKTCLEARDNYTEGYETNWFSAKEVNRDDPKLQAYRRAWKEVSKKEQPDIAKLNLAQSLGFLAVCYKEGEQFEILVTHIENLIKDDVQKKLLFLSAPHYHTFYAGDCPFEALVDKTKKEVEEHYVGKIKKTYGKENILKLKKEIFIEFTGINFSSRVYERLAQKMYRRAKTVKELYELPAMWVEYRIGRYQEIKKKTSAEELIKASDTILREIQNTRWDDDLMGNDPTRNKIEWETNYLFSRCETIEQAEILLRKSRPYLRSKDTDLAYENYTQANQRILQAMYPQPKIEEFQEWYNLTCMNSRYRSKVEDDWKEASMKALQKPIPDFAKLYKQVHKSYQFSVLKKWNEWGLKQLDGLENFDELLGVDQTFFPSPQGRAYWTYQVWFKAHTNPYSTFRIWLQILTKKARKREQMRIVLDIILQKRRKQDECPTGTSFFDEELENVTKKILASRPTTAYLHELYVSMRNHESNPKSFITKSRKIVMEAIVEKEPSKIDYILSEIDTHNEYYDEFFEKKLALAMLE